MASTLLSRRSLMTWLGAGTVSLVATRAFAEQSNTKGDSLKPGQFTWNPEDSPTGPLAVVVSLPDQRVYVYRNGVRIAVSTCSTGKPGHRTPTGVFTILQKDKNHHSSTYNNAPMPNMNRLTWSGIALHAGELPGYPASHGCVRLPLAFSQKLFTITQIGTPVIIADAATFPTTIVHPGMVLSADAAKEFNQTVVALKKQEPPAPVAIAEEHTPIASSIMVSSADNHIIVMDNGKIITEGKVTITDPTTPLGNHVFILTYLDSEQKKLSWQVIGYYDNAKRRPEDSDLETIQRIQAEHKVVEAIRTRMNPGTLLLTVDTPLTPDTRSKDGFVVMTDTDDS